MNGRRAHAPGKVVLSGEYAVLFGAPAVSMAVNRRAVAAFEEDATQDPDSRLLDAVCESLERSPPETPLRLDTEGFRDPQSGRKYGIGSSAALTAALVALLVDKGNEPQLASLAQAAHRRFQDGAGSGVDIATSVDGGIILYRMQSAENAALVWPEGLHYQLYWSGTESDTRDRIRRVGDEVPAELLAAAESTARAWQSQDADNVLDSYREYLPVLHSFDADRQLGIFAAGHAALGQLAADAHIIYKPCGAGGGDIGIALASDEESIAAFTAAASASGFDALDLEIDWQGVTVEESPAALDGGAAA